MILFRPARVLRSSVWLSIVLLSLSLQVQSQNNITLQDGRNEPACERTRQLLEEMPDEVLFGISIDTATGDVYFTMSSRAWFDELLQGPRDGVTADILVKSQYDCNSPAVPSGQLPKGVFLPVVYLSELRQKMEDDGLGAFSVKIGQVPASLRTNMRDLEGNLVLVKNGMICHYLNFVDIDRSLWDLLPMGLHTDTVISTEKLLEPGTAGLLQYNRKLQFIIPFCQKQNSI